MFNEEKATELAACILSWGWLNEVYQAAQTHLSS